MTLPLELGGIHDNYSRRAFELVGQAFPVTLANQAAGGNGNTTGSFSAYRNAALTVVTGTAIIFDAEEFDISGWHNTASGQYTPLVAGYYHFSWLVTANAVLAADVFWRAELFKNGALLKSAPTAFQRGGAAAVGGGGSAIAQANGTTDVFTVVLAHGVGATQAILALAPYTFFQGELIGR